MKKERFGELNLKAFQPSQSRDMRKGNTKITKRRQDRIHTV